LALAWALELDRRQPTVGNVLVAVGLRFSRSRFRPTAVRLVPVEFGLVGTLVAAIALAFLAVRHDAQIIASRAPRGPRRATILAPRRTS